MNLVVPKFLERDGLAGYEPKALACFLTAIGTAHDGAVWDVGANVGVYGMVARALTDRAVRAFEPEPDIAALALRTAVSNGLFHPVETLALGSERGSATFYLSDRGDSSNSLARDFRPSSRSLTVAVETIDEIVFRTGEHPAVLKIDTETTESDVLRGAAKTVAEHRPWILCEVLSGTRYGQELMEVMGPWGYHWYHIAGEFPLAPAAEIRGDNSATMWLFTPEPVPPEFWNDAQEWFDRLAECAPNDEMTSLRKTREQLRYTERRLADTRRRLKESQQQTERARTRTAALQNSATMQVGRIVTHVVRHPLRGALAAPGHAMRLLRKRLDG